MKDTFFVLAIFGGVVMGLAILIVMELHVDNFGVWAGLSDPIGSVLLNFGILFFSLVLLTIIFPGRMCNKLRLLKQNLTRPTLSQLSPVLENKQHNIFLVLHHLLVH